MGVRCFLLDDIPLCRVGLRRYLSRGDGSQKCPSREWGCDTRIVWLFYAETFFVGEGDNRHIDDHWGNNSIPHDHPLWPTACEYCQQPIPPDAVWQVFTQHCYQRRDTREILILRDAPPGAVWDAWWMPKDWKGADGRSMMAKLPNGNEWAMDARASNCDSPCKTCGIPYHQHKSMSDVGHYYEDARPHKCWVRHGEPPLLTVDKSGVTCGAGAGSILSGNYHGFLGTNGAAPGEFTAG